MKNLTEDRKSTQPGHKYYNLTILALMPHCRSRSVECLFLPFLFLLAIADVEEKLILLKGIAMRRWTSGILGVIRFLSLIDSNRR